MLFYQSEEPEFLLVRPRGSEDVVYLGGDASAAAFGSGEQRMDGTVTVWMGNWTPAETAKGSNWREASNLARIFLSQIKAGRMDGMEVWMAWKFGWQPTMWYGLSLQTRGCQSERVFATSSVISNSSVAGTKYFGILFMFRD